MFRKTQNQLLSKDDVGKSKPSMRTLPEPEFAYGHPIPKETDGVGKLTSIWSLHQRSMKGLPDKDFKTLNKASIYNKAVTCQTQYNFRQNVDIRLKEPRRQGPMYLPQEEFTYGRQNRPSTPIKAVVSGFYGDVNLTSAECIIYDQFITEQQILTRYDILKEQAKPISLAQARNHTRGSQMFSDHLRQTARDEQFRQSKTLFKMKKFQNAAQLLFFIQITKFLHQEPTHITMAAQMGLEELAHKQFLAQITNKYEIN